MQIETRDFGLLDIDENEMVKFVEPIYGFEKYSKYVLLSDDEAGNGILWLQSTENPDVCFILIDPEAVGFDYVPELPDSTRQLLQLKDQVAVRVIAVIPENFQDTTVNLKSPIILNKENKWAAQVILEEDYPIRMRVFNKEGE